MPTLPNKPAPLFISKNRPAMLSGPEFNRTIVDAPLNKSISKASFAFSKAQRFSNVSVNEKGFAIPVLKGTETRSRQFNMTSATTTGAKPSGMASLSPRQ